ncbi:MULTISPECIES: hypothetical protein [unclassified Chryseobacterium]|uniref:hypothetical protein n=1 Tax=unclassified Chryseobacterium TaxID=2593645 RepID=UPI001F1F7B8D|nr:MULTISPECIES: hypothetical protein [unclassified Chryseobacterium]
MISKMLSAHFAGIFLPLSLFVFMPCNGQIGIGKTSVDGDGILDFGDSPKGIVLPLLPDLPASPSPGTFVVDNSDLKVKVFSNGNWISLTDVPGNSDRRMINPSAETGRGVIIGAPDSPAKGVLVLESENKALILPKVANPHLNIPNPVIGTLCYDTVSKTLAVFDGNQWHYWK